MRNFKAIGLALVAMFAMSAVVASAAQAEPSHLRITNTTGDEVETSTLTGEQVGGAHTFQTGARTLTCATADFHGHASSSTPTTQTITPTYETCHTAPVLGVSLPATVTMEGCDYNFTTTGKDGSGNHTASVDIECPPTKAISVHIYNNPAHGAGNLVCTKTIAPQGPKPGNTITNTSDGTHWDLLIHHEVVVTVYNHVKSLICGNNTEENATYRGTTTMTAETSPGGEKLNLTAITTS